MKFLYGLFILLTPLTVIGQSSLPTCPGDNGRWTNCWGSQTLRDGTQYVGEFRDGKPHGQGSSNFPNGQTYKGEYAQGLKNGRGSQTWPDGAVYSGQWKDNNFHGQGTLTLSNGNQYAGQFQNGLYSGQGVFSYANGEKYSGDYRAGKPTGHATYSWPDGRMFVGTFLDGEPEGDGVEYLANGKVKQSGRWSKGNLVRAYPLDPARFGATSRSNPIQAASSSNHQQVVVQPIAPIQLPFCKPGGPKHNCIGEDRFFPLDKYFGEFVDGKPNGMGVATFASGNSYVGEFKNSEFHGQGAYSFATGEKYFGEFQNGRYEGAGTYIYAKDNNKRYVGMWRNARNHGEGIVYSADGQVLQTGVWSNGAFESKTFLDEKKWPFDAHVKTQPARVKEQRLSQLKRFYEFFNATEIRSLPVKERLDKYVQAELKQWASIQPPDIDEVPPPTYPAAISLKQEAWESNKEFEDRVFKAREDRRQAIDKIQAAYKQQVERRNQRVEDYNKQRANREAGLSNQRRELVIQALTLLNPDVSVSEVSFDQQSGAVSMSAQVEGLGKQYFIFNNAPQEFRRTALTAANAMKARPSFEVSDLGEIRLQSVTVDAAGISVRGVPSAASVNTTTQLASVNLPAVPVQAIAQQSGVSVDKNQIEQILYKDENQLLRKRLDEQRKQQEQAVAMEQSKLQAEIARLKAEADALRQQPAQARLPSQVATIKSAHALVIGNSAYPGSGKLDNPVNDAKAISEKLRGMGFEVREVTNASRDAMVRELSEFNRVAAKADLSLLYYAGHGVQISGINYMIPIDMKLNDATQAAFQAVSLNQVLEGYLPGKTKLVFLDACRDNPLQVSSSRGISKGLAPINASEGTLIAYATKDGQTAEDGAGDKNSPFTRALLEHLNDADDIGVVLRSVRAKVMQRTNNRQQPWEYGSLTGGALILSAIKPKE